MPRQELIRLSSNPLAVTLLVGPAAITFVMVFSDFYDVDALFLNFGSILIVKVDTCANLY